MRPPILWIALGFGTGLWIGLDGSRSAGIGTWGAVVPTVLLAAALLLARRAPVGAAVGIAGVAGLLWGAAAEREQAATCAGIWGRGNGEGGGVMRAAVVRLADPASPAGGVVDARAIGGPCGGGLRLRWPEGSPAHGGTRWVVSGRWVGDMQRGVLIVRRARVLDREPRGRGALRDALAARSARLFGDRAPLVDALVIGRRAELASDVRERYTRSGLAHLLSISGLHVGFLAAWIAVLLRLARFGRAARFWSSAGLVAGYIWLLGFPAPATRAAWMLQIDAVARLRQRVVAPRGTIGVAVFAVLVVDPWAVRSVGAWLSVAAVTAVIWAGRVTVGSPAPVRLLAPAVAATLLTAPIAAFAFGTVAPIGVVANLVAIPLGAVAVPGLIIALLLSWVWSAGAELLAAGAGLILALLDLVAATAARVPGGHAITAPGWPAAGLWGAIAWVAWWLWRSPRRKWLIAARLAFVATLCLATSFLHDWSLDDCHCLTVHFLDVGQGDAAVLRTPAGHWIVIDGGPRTAERDAGRRVVVPFLRRHGVERVAIVVATHGHADHVGGLPALLAAFPPGTVLEPGEPVGEAPYLEFLAAVEASGATWRPARAGDRLELDGVALQVLSPDSAWAAWTMDPNEESVVLLVEYGGRRLVFTGDAGLPVEARLAGRIGDVDVLKVGHHGSRSATSAPWLAELRPEVAVVSVGERNRYGHPAADVLTRLATWNVRVLRTDQTGTITLRIDSARADTDLRHHD